MTISDHSQVYLTSLSIDPTQFQPVEPTLTTLLLLWEINPATLDQLLEIRSDQILHGPPKECDKSALQFHQE